MNRITNILLGGAITLLIVSACEPEPSPSAPKQSVVRFATFNIAMGLEQRGAMAAALESGQDARLKALAAVLQTVRPDVVLLNEFDYDPAVDAAGLLNRNYLERAGDDRQSISYPHSLRPKTNTGIDSGLDLDRNGVTGEPADAWGFGHFPGQYGMLILSRFPIDRDAVRTFQMFPWSKLPGALRPENEDGSHYYPDAVWAKLRLSSKNHLDVPIDLGEHTVHLLASHPTPPVFDGPEDRNGKRNHDEIAFWRHYIAEPSAPWIIDDAGRAGGLEAGAAFVIAGDLNADPNDGDAYPGAIAQLLDHPGVNSDCTPKSEGGAEAAEKQAGINLEHSGDPAADTSDFNDETAGNYRIDYVLPSRGLKVDDCGVYWPESTSPEHEFATFSDHRLVWVDLEL